MRPSTTGPPVSTKAPCAAIRLSHPLQRLASCCPATSLVGLAPPRKSKRNPATSSASFEPILMSFHRSSCALVSEGHTAEGSIAKEFIPSCFSAFHKRSCGFALIGVLLRWDTSPIGIGSKARLRAMRRGRACNDRKKHICAVDHTQGEDRRYRQNLRASHSLISLLSAMRQHRRRPQVPPELLRAPFRL